VLVLATEVILASTVFAEPTPRTCDAPGGPCPWVAFYDQPNWGQPSICLNGSGLANLSDYGWVNRAQSINVSSNAGCFYDNEFGQGYRWCFKGNFRDNDLGPSTEGRLLHFLAVQRLQEVEDEREDVLKHSLPKKCRSCGT
jgi:hypothetical protein